MRVNHPIALEDEGVTDGAVDVNGESVPVADDGTLEVPDSARSWLQSWASNYGYEAGELVVGDGDESATDEDVAEAVSDEGDSGADEAAVKTVGQEIDDGECPWCSEYTGENVGQHASSAHPDAWDDYKTDDED